MAKTQSELQAKVSHFNYYTMNVFQPFLCSFHWIGQILMPFVIVFLNSSTLVYTFHFLQVCRGI